MAFAIDEDETFNAGEGLLERAAQRGEAPIFVDDENGWDAGALRARAHDVQRALQTRGLTPGARVLLLLLDRRLGIRSTCFI